MTLYRIVIHVRYRFEAEDIKEAMEEAFKMVAEKIGKDYIENVEIGEDVLF